MTRTLIDVDDEALAGAARELGTKTKVDTINRALAHVAGRSARLAFLEDLRSADDDLGNADVMDRAWQ